RRLIDIGGDYAGVSVDGPANAALHQILKAGIAPGALIVAPGGVEDPAFALCADPGPWLFTALFPTILQDIAVFGIVLGMHVRLVPALKAAEAFHDGVVGSGDGGAKNASPMTEELRTHQVDIFGGI